MDAQTIIIDPEVREENGKSYRYLSCAFWKDAASRTQNKKTPNTVSIQPPGSGVVLNAELVTDFKIEYDFDGPSLGIKYYGDRIRRVSDGQLVSKTLEDNHPATFWERENKPRNETKEIQECIERFVKRAISKNYKGDKRGTTLNLQVASGAADAYEMDDNTGYTNSSANTWIYAAAAASNRANSAFYFPSVSIPAGSTIDACTFDVYLNLPAYDDIYYNTGFEDSNNASSLATSADVTGRLPMTNYVTYGPSTGIGTGWKTSGDISAELQPIIDGDFGAWTSGNALMLLMEGFNGTPANQWRARAYDGDASLAVKLDIDYTRSPVPIIYQQH